MKPTLVILAGGKGTRLGKLTENIPKPMVEVCGKPFLYWLIQHYVNQGFTDIRISTGYKADLIKNYKWPWILSFVQDPPLAYGCTKDIALESLLRTKKITQAWIVNGDTYIPKPLPEVEDPTIMSNFDRDAGAQYVITHKILRKVEPSGVFYDIGTPESLQIFTEYAKTHLVKF